MFDFQKEVIINVNDEKIFKDFTNAIRIDGMLYKKAYMGPVYKTVGYDGDAATITINVSDVNAGKQQIIIELGLDNDYRGEFGSALYYFRKPILIDAREAMTADSLKAALKKVCASNGNVLKFTNPDAEDAFVLEAVDNFITVRKAEVVKFACESVSCNDDMMEVASEKKDLAVTPNKAGFANYDYMLHNLRLPTYANIRFASPNVEMPVKGGVYTQYSFEYTVPRRLGGLSVAGQKTESTTIHTFFVLNSVVSDFESALTKAGIECNLVNEVEKSHVKGEDGKTTPAHDSIVERTDEDGNDTVVINE